MKVGGLSDTVWNGDFGRICKGITLSHYCNKSKLEFVKEQRSRGVDLSNSASSLTQVAFS